MWSASALSNLGDGVRLTALPLMAAFLSRDPIDVAAVTAVTMVPWLLFGPLGGAIVDRADRRSLIIWGQLGRGIGVGLFAVAAATGNASLPALYALAFVIGSGEVIVDSSAQAAIPRLADVGQLERANSRFIAVEVLTNDVLGGPLGGALFAAAIALPFGLDAATFVGGAILVSMIRSPLQGDRSVARGPLSSDMREGFAYLWSSSVLRGLAIAVGFFNLSITAASSLMVLLVLDDLGSTGIVFGFIGGIAAIGGIAGSLVAELPTRRFGRRAVMMGSTLLVGLGCLAISLAGSVAPVTAGAAATSLGVSSFNVVGRSLRQRLVPDRLLGRVVASFRIIGLGAIPVGALLGGWFASLTSVRATYLYAAISSVPVAAVFQMILHPDRVQRELDGLA